MSNTYLVGTKGRGGLHVSSMEAYSTVEKACLASYRTWTDRFNNQQVSNTGFVYELGVDTKTVSLVTDKERTKVLNSMGIGV